MDSSHPRSTGVGLDLKVYIGPSPTNGDHMGRLGIRSGAPPGFGKKACARLGVCTVLRRMATTQCRRSDCFLQRW